MKVYNNNNNNDNNNNNSDKHFSVKWTHLTCSGEPLNFLPKNCNVTTLKLRATNIIGGTGIVTRSLRKNLETVPGRHSIDSLQKTGILGTSHIIRKVLQCEA